ncbi:hypothetical protein YC2023_108213 [Brassica napus]
MSDGGCTALRCFSCKAPHILRHVDQHASVACVATSRAWPIHLVLLHVKLHVQLPCMAAPRASVFWVPTGMLTVEPFSEDQGRSAVHPLLGPYFKTGRMGSPQADALSTQMPRHAVRRMLQTTIKAATSPRAGPDFSVPHPTGMNRRPPSASLPTIQALFDSLFKVLFIFTSRYLFAIGSGQDGALTLSGALSRELGPGSSLRMLLQTTIRTPKTSDFQARLFPVISPDLGHVEDFGSSRAFGPEPYGNTREISFCPISSRGWGATICDTQADVPSARRIGAQLAFKDLMVHGILQFTPSIAFCYVLHRCESRDTVVESRFRLYIAALLPNKHRLRVAYDPTKTEVLGMDEHITTESAGIVRNRPTESDATESDVSSFSGRSVSRAANHPRRRDPNTSPDHSIGRSDGRCVQRAGT